MEIKKQFFYEICQKHKVIIRYLETDKDHIHYMTETEPTMSVSKIVNLMKSYTTYHIWERYPNYLRKYKVNMITINLIRRIIRMEILW